MNNLDIFDIFLYLLKDLHLSRSTSEYNKFDSICKQIYRENISKAGDYITYRYEKKSLVNCKDHSSFDFFSAVLIHIHLSQSVDSFPISTQKCRLTVGWQSVIFQSTVGHLTVVSRQYVSPSFITSRSWFKLFQHLRTNLSWKYLKRSELHYF